MMREREDRTLIGGFNHGYTLIEVILVLTIMSLMMAAVVPLYQGSLTWARRDRAVRDVLAALKYAQERAIADSTEYRFYLNGDNGEFWLMRFKALDKREKVFEPLDEAAGEVARLPESVRVERTKAAYDKKRDAHYIAFYPNGACDYASIELEYDRRSGVKISTKGRLGRLDVEED
jgi:prepilin-type N-terminal cleavage/methylation domain-containing protein